MDIKNVSERFEHKWICHSDV